MYCTKVGLCFFSLEDKIWNAIAVQIAISNQQRLLQLGHEITLSSISFSSRCFGYRLSSIPFFQDQTLKFLLWDGEIDWFPAKDNVPCVIWVIVFLVAGSRWQFRYCITHGCRVAIMTRTQLWRRRKFCLSLFWCFIDTPWNVLLLLGKQIRKHEH
jgi:hypothetical protein